MDQELRDAILDLADRPSPGPADTASPEALTTALYDCLSGPSEKEEPRDWDRLRALFLPGARLVLVRWRSPETGDEAEEVRAWDVDGFVEAARQSYRDQAFYEEEIALHTEVFGNIAHAFSTYESRVGDPGSDPIMRGINSVQMVRSEGRWWIAHLIWDVEGPELPIPAVYLPEA